MKKRFAFLCAVFLVLTLCLFPALTAGASWDPIVEEVILQGCAAQKSEISLAGYSLTAEELEVLYPALLDSGRMPWYVADSWQYSYMEDTRLVTAVFPEYLDEPLYDQVAYEQRVAEILEDVLHDGMSQWQIALALHDYLIVSSFYDETYSRYTGYDLLVDGSAVCSGYAYAYMDLMNRAGIPCRLVSSEAMDHGWNLVQLDGHWYHVDLTWDDPFPDAQGQVLHKYFLVSDAQMLADHENRLAEGEDPGHHDWQTDIQCTDESYKDAFWVGVDSQICYLDADTSFFRREEDWDHYIYRRDENTGEVTLLLTDEEDYVDIGYGSNCYSHTGLALWQDRLYCSTMDKVYSMALDGSDLTTLYSHDTAGNDTIIYSISVREDMLYLTLSDHDFSNSLQQIPLEPTGYHVHSYTHTHHPATCLEEGREDYDCSCGIHLEFAGEDALWHDYAYTVVKEPTLLEEGREKYTCRHCSDTYYIDIPVLTIWEWLVQWLRSLFS